MAWGLEEGKESHYGHSKTPQGAGQCHLQQVFCFVVVVFSVPAGPRCFTMGEHSGCQHNKPIMEEQAAAPASELQIIVSKFPSLRFEIC